MDPAQLYNLKVDPAQLYNLKVDPAQAVVWRGPMVMGALNKLVTQTHWGHLDILGNLYTKIGRHGRRLLKGKRLKYWGAIHVNQPNIHDQLILKKCINYLISNFLANITVKKFFL